MYADADFFFALLKEDDWLKTRAEFIFEKERKEIWTSVATMIEIMFRANKKGINTNEALLSLQNFVPIVPLFKDHIISAAVFKDQYPDLDTLDAIHAAVAQFVGERKIISSDKIFEHLGFERIKLEK